MLNMELPYNPYFPFLGIYTQDKWKFMFTQKLVHEYV